VGGEDLLFFIHMAFEAEVVPPLLQEFRVLGGMRVVTLAAHAVLEGCVHDCATGLQVLKHMTLLTETAGVLLFQCKGFPRGRGVMAHVTAPRHDRVMRARLQEFRLVRRVRIVADNAGFRLNGIVPVRLHERRVTFVMTGQAEGRFLLYQEVLLVRTVRWVTHATTLRLQYLMHCFLLKVLFLMALIAEVLSLRLKEMTRLRRMRIVTGRTLSLFQGSMKDLLVKARFLALMTIEAEVGYALLQEERGYDAMPQMAVLTLLLLHDCVHIFHAKVCVRKFGMAFQAILASNFFLRRRPGCGKKDDAQEKNCSKSVDPLLCKSGPHRYLLTILFTLLFCRF
jgi:hypothetical protein